MGLLGRIRHSSLIEPGDEFAGLGESGELFVVCGAGTALGFAARESMDSHGLTGRAGKARQKAAPLSCSKSSL